MMASPERKSWSNRRRPAHLAYRLRQAEQLGREIGEWPAPVAVIRHACGTGPEVEYPRPPEPVRPAAFGGFGMTMEELANAMYALVGHAQAAAYEGGCRAAAEELRQFAAQQAEQAARRSISD